MNHIDAWRQLREDVAAFLAHVLEFGLHGPDVELRLYEGGCHEPHNDLEAPEVLTDIAAWMDRH